MSFEWPWQYNFPPFFTLQPNVDTRQKQLAAWCSLALSYCRHHKLYTLDVMEAQESPMFNNKKIERKLSMEAIQVVFEELRKKGNLEWLDKNKSRCLVMWRRPEEWGKLIYQWSSTVWRTGCCFARCRLYRQKAKPSSSPWTMEKASSSSKTVLESHTLCLGALILYFTDKFLLRFSHLRLHKVHLNTEPSGCWSSNCCCLLIQSLLLLEENQYHF
ncbi:unnamed protein product [Oreochromis niloticus]|nr:unnamed protein product [Mustela putorius furo]